MAGLLNGAMAGLGKGLSESGDFLMRAKADEVKESWLQKFELAKEQRKNQREDAQGAAAVLREDAQRDEERGWELADADRDHARDIQLQKIRNQNGYGNSPTANQREAQWLVDNGIASSLDDAWPMVRSGNEGDKQDYIDNRVEELSKALDDPDFGMNSNGTDDEIELERQRMREELSYYQQQREQVASERYGIQPPRSPSSSGASAQASPPEAALNFLRSNNTPEVRRQFEAKYGHIPEDLK
ncbi:hypothetical protein BDK62_1249 [Halomonas alkaliantarctica]|nr:hypothetical protein BDK62_1249 [Halomonas alkaliantarctica]